MNYTLTAAPTGIERMTKPELVELVNRDPGFIWAAYPPARWSKTELVDYCREMRNAR